ncbi:hypothetical protein [Hymenobacter jeollabukensis]|uniref:STAS/SEC14 domain-containing protein n=1 Tax=Hymenobacter jeollabukensis TaxID=2025313 RepID=A0A5R8WSH8_9BACT|nr:hypothetical protein [Hymenobacter jeollabukensis]TLM94112.1 hypothetical protein FDY95_08805 [Hymenobacter jeollabukensis]
MSPLLPDRETVFFRNAAGSVIFHSAGYVELAWRSSRIELGELQAFYEQALKLLQSTGSGRILSVHGQRQPLSTAAQQWLTGDWIPRAIRQAGFRHCAIVEGQDPVHRLSTQGVVSSAPTTVEFRRFPHRADAETWLTSQRAK